MGIRNLSHRNMSSKKAIRADNRKRGTGKVPLLIACFLLVLIISSCKSLPFTKKEASSDEDQRKGTEGIIAAFVSTFGKEMVVNDDLNNPTPEISFLVELKNNGAFPVGMPADGAVWLSGYDPTIIQLDADGYSKFESGQGINALTLEGRSAQNPLGGSGFKEFKGKVDVSKIPIQGKYKANILANLCYSYETIANPIVCIEKSPFEVINEKKACTMKDISLQSQGAPIALTKVEQIHASGKIQFKMTIRNVGKGITLERNLNGCAKDEVSKAARHQTDVVSIESVSIGESKLDCQGNEVRLIDGIGYFICSLDKSFIDAGTRSSSFATPLVVHLLYVYKDSVENPITITKI